MLEQGMLSDISFEFTPKVFYLIQVRIVTWPLYNLDVVSQKLLLHSLRWVFLLLSCWNVHTRGSPSLVHAFSKKFLLTNRSILHSTWNIGHPPFHKQQTQTIMLPPPCFTVFYLEFYEFWPTNIPLGMISKQICFCLIAPKNVVPLFWTLCYVPDCMTEGKILPHLQSCCSKQRHFESYTAR